MKQKTIATRHLCTKIAAGYVLILFVIFGIVYIWLNEQHRRQELEITSQKIRCLRKDIHEVYVKMVDLSLIGETVLDWNEEDMNIYHKKRLEVDSLLSLFKSSYRSERIDSVCRLLAEKENLLNKIMLVPPCRRICSNKTNVPADLHELLSAAKNLTRLMCRLICNLPELSIRIFNPITSYFLINRYESRIADPYIFCCRIAYPAEQ